MPGPSNKAYRMAWRYGKGAAWQHGVDHKHLTQRLNIHLSMFIVSCEKIGFVQSKSDDENIHHGFIAFKDLNFKMMFTRNAIMQAQLFDVFLKMKIINLYFWSKPFHPHVSFPGKMPGTYRWSQSWMARCLRRWWQSVAVSGFDQPPQG